MFAGAKLDKFPGVHLLDLFKSSSSAPNTPAHNSKVNNHLICKFNIYVISVEFRLSTETY